MPRNFLPLIVLFTLLGTAALTRDKRRTPSPPPNPTIRDNWAQNTLNNLSMEEKVGQLFMIRMRVEFLNSESPEYIRLRESIRKYHVGSLAMSVPAAGRFLNGNDRYQTVNLLNQLQTESKLPLLVAGDFERGVLPAQLFGTTVFPHAMAFGATGNLSYAEEFGRITAQESRALGVHWNLFPVADVNPIRRTPSSVPAPSAKTRFRSATWWPPTSAVPAPAACSPPPSIFPDTATPPSIRISPFPRSPRISTA